MTPLFRTSRMADELPVHRIDEEYSFSRSNRDTVQGSPRGSVHEIRRDSVEHPRPVTMSVQHEFYDPGERIPSYESSQEQHARRPLRPSARSSHDLSGVISIRDAMPERGRSIPLEMPPVITTTNTRNRGGPDSGNGRARDRDSTQSPVRDEKRSLKTLGLKFLNARQHFLLAACRDFSLIPCVFGLCQSWWMLFKGVEFEQSLNGITAARMSEHFLTGMWCLVAGYLSYSVLDGLMVRWIVSYTTTGSIVRMATMSAILVAVEQYLVAAFSAEGYNYALHTWILISCALTLLYILQNFITSNIDLKGKYRPRFFDFYNIVVFAVVPVGMASFITMVGLLRSLLILRLDVDQQSA
ncbi:hypothetical protein JCM33374_g2615 [Metschnikowia sp. JCM 33374]|nr:hypothetical protein JCM33374_g2615 [Metschnikowia sp. JCM 33374]